MKNRDGKENYMSGIHVYSEIKPLKRVLLHRPGDEFLNLTPNTLERLLFDDIPFLKKAQEEHDVFAGALRAEGVEVVYLVDLAAEALDTHPKVREKFLKQFIKEGRTLPSRKNKDFYERMAIKFGYKNPQSIYRIVLGCTNRFFGENIVQTTNRSGNENCSGKGELD